ncbi:MAG TPA: lipoprotein-releasing system ATP-binding protein LolD [Gammaproteobacteria bacterium]|jgi:lipoprotein-releasing system ATP-binding protein|nr:MAG: ABC transporter ATP-binding protein [Gammaproteobacteria bacterium TMED134]RZO71627.1 MAG: ABC transporter ATP-binding protein [OM182 bacterium]HAL40887.1 lipoprotein-releasing system ATP-binding protein LolD [Gammaproteobacteria bacterium]HBK17601.1 lipoprotein-releasing system ATP-binding protein LolD [Gammaproteobacteria bacterium]|tara:strand:+ start:13850 stop:14539 length:690 start_codon:yes stop_codon:yes gene_type:complete
MSKGTPTLVAQDVVKKYVQGDADVPVLLGVDLKIEPGERVAIVGRSGSGKSCLLHILAGLESLDTGMVTVHGHDMVNADSDQRARLRRQYLGFVYQQHHLLPEFSALENVAIPQRLNGVGAEDAETNSRQLLERVELSHRLDHLPQAMSGGERQRVAVARALAHRPRLVLADEPTGNLDEMSSHHLMRMLVDLSEEQGTGFLIVTHDLALLSYFDRVLTLQNGRLSSDS